MDDRTRLGLGLLLTALLVGLLGDVLLRATPWGVNILLWTIVVAAGSVLLMRFGGVAAAGEGRWLVPVALLFAAGFAWRDSPAVAALNLLALLAAAALAMLKARSGALWRARLSEYLLGGLYAGALTAAGPVPVAASDVRWREAFQGRWKGSVVAATRGLFLAVPLLLAFGGLLVAADAVFEELVTEVLGFDVAEILNHLLLVVFFAWTSAGLLWGGLLARTPQRLYLRRPGVLSLGVVEVAVVLGLLDALFLAFVTVQVRYLFGGARTVVESVGLTYAEYARRGFFELVAVTALALPLLLLAHWLLRAESRAHERAYRVLSGAMVALLFAIVVSALHRMRLYVAEFGLTELRFFTTAFMGWVACVLAWFVFTVLRGRRDRFAFGALVAGFAAILLINVANPDALIARVNLERMERGERFDACYLTGLSADAAPVLLEALPRLEGEARRTIEEDLRARWYGASHPDWRTWNLSRSRARHLANTHLDSTEWPGSGQELRR